MPKGRVVRQDDAAAEILKVRAEKKLDENLFNALTAEEGGVLAAGALPAVKAASASGAQKIMESLNDGAKVVKAPKPKKDKKPDEPVKPKSILEPGPQGLKRLQLLVLLNPLSIYHVTSCNSVSPGQR